VAGGSLQLFRNGRLVTQLSIGPDGRFRLEVAAGHYELVARNSGGYKSTARADVTVAPSAVVRVTLTVDSGIR
jgi:hypothetical protein